MDYRVDIPEEVHKVFTFRQDKKTGIAVVNSALALFEPKVVFGWHLSVMLDLLDLIDNRMPSQAERDVIDAFGDRMDQGIKGNPNQPNALFLARITWDGTRELIYRVHDPEPANDYLRSVIRSSPPREFDYRIDPDDQWKLAKWHLRASTDA